MARRPRLANRPVDVTNHVLTVRAAARAVDAVGREHARVLFRNRRAAVLALGHLREHPRRDKHSSEDGGGHDTERV